MNLNILVVYYHRFSHPIKKTMEDHVYCFDKYSEERIFYLNTAYGIPSYLFKINFDLVVYQTLFLYQIRLRNKPYEKAVEPFLALKNIKGIKAALPQDEFFRTEHLDRFINDFGVEVVFSVAEESEWQKIYPKVERNRVRFYKVLTGYLEEHIVGIVKQLNSESIQRDVDVGYRARHAQYWFGRHGMLKVQVAEKVNERAPKWGIQADISTEEKDTFFGLDWYRFMLRCKYMIGVEGGSSILDSDGSLLLSIDAYLKLHPKASFEETEQTCFFGKDGCLQLFAISPRHLEACATKTCQILIEGDYSGILKPGLHYIELKKDFSNLDEVLRIVKEDQIREEVVSRAYQDIVLSGKYTYQAFVDMIFSCSLEEKSPVSKAATDHIYYRLNKFREWLQWKYLAAEAFVYRVLKKIYFKWEKHLPQSFVRQIRAKRRASA